MIEMVDSLVNPPILNISCSGSYDQHTISHCAVLDRKRKRSTITGRGWRWWGCKLEGRVRQILHTFLKGYSLWVKSDSPVDCFSETSWSSFISCHHLHAVATYSRYEVSVTGASERGSESGSQHGFKQAWWIIPTVLNTKYGGWFLKWFINYISIFFFFTNKVGNLLHAFLSSQPLHPDTPK